MIDHQHWHDRWREDRIGFHESSVNPQLLKHFPSFVLPKAARIFVPLCGKTLDLIWLADQGYQVLGIELSKIALKAFFAEQGREYTCSETDRFRIYHSGNLTLLEGDFFDLCADDLRGCVMTYDRASLIALETADRLAYYQQMRSILPPDSDMLLMTLEYDQTEMRGPPFAVLESEVRNHYQEDFVIEVLERNQVIDERPRWRKVGLSAIDEVVLRLDRR